MGSAKMGFGRVFLVRVDHDADLIKYLTDWAKKQGVSAATFTAVGALKWAKLAFYDQQKHVYMENFLDVPLEIAICVGNVALKDGEPFVHAHAVLGDRQGNAKAGHLLEGKVFAAEVHVVELLGKKIERRPDAVTGLSLWEI